MRVSFKKRISSVAHKDKHLPIQLFKPTGPVFVFSVILLLIVVSVMGFVLRSYFVKPLPDEAANFILHISNQSFQIASVDVTVMIDGEPIVSGDMEVGDQHNWHEFRFNLAPGTHFLKIDSRNGQANLDKEFFITDRHWAIIIYRCCDSNETGYFTYEMRDEPFFFL